MERVVSEAERAFQHVAGVLARHLGRTPLSYGLLVDDLHVYRAIVSRRGALRNGGRAMKRERLEALRAHVSERQLTFEIGYTTAMEFELEHRRALANRAQSIADVEMLVGREIFQPAGDDSSSASDP